MRRRRILNIIISLLLFCAVFVLCGKIMRYLVTDDTRSYTRVTFHELYEQDNIDVTGALSRRSSTGNWGSILSMRELPRRAWTDP